MNIDTKKLRKDMIDDFSAAMAGGFPMAIADLTKAECASDEELINFAKENKINLSKYDIDK